MPEKYVEDTAGDILDMLRASNLKRTDETN